MPALSYLGVAIGLPNDQVESPLDVAYASAFTNPTGRMPEGVTPASPITGHAFARSLSAYPFACGYAEQVLAVYVVANPVAYISGTVRDSAGAFTSRTVRAYRRDTGALIGSAVSDAATGAYSIGTTHTGEHTVVCLDNDGGTLENDLVHRAFPV